MKKFFVAVALGVAGVVLAWGCARLAPGANSAAPTAGKTSQSTLQERLRGIVIPKIDYTNTAMEDVFRDISRKVATLDPKGEPLCFITYEPLEPVPVQSVPEDDTQAHPVSGGIVPESVVQTSAPDSGASTAPIPAGEVPPFLDGAVPAPVPEIGVPAPSAFESIVPDPPVAEEVKAPEPVQTLLTQRREMSLINVPADEALHYICMSADLKYQFMEPNIVVLYGEKTFCPWEMVTRSYPFDPKRIQDSFVGSSKPAPAGSGSKEAELSPEESLHREIRITLQAYGVQFPYGAHVMYDSGARRLFVTLPPSESAKLDALCVPIIYVPMGEQLMMVESKLIRVPELALTKLGIDPVSETGRWSEVAASPAAETLTSGAVMTMSGMEAVLESVTKESSSVTGIGKEKLSGTPAVLGYSLRVTSGYADRSDDTGRHGLRVKVMPEYVGRNGVAARASVSGQSLPEMVELKHPSEIWVGNGPKCVWGQKRTGVDGKGEWLFLLAAANLVHPDSSELIARWNREIPPVPPAQIKNPSPKLSAILKKAMISDVAPTAELGAVLTAKFKEFGVDADLVGKKIKDNSIDGSTTIDQRFRLPVKIGVYGKVALGKLVEKYLRMLDLEAIVEADGRLVAKSLYEKRDLVIPWDMFEQRMTDGKNPPGPEYRSPDFSPEALRRGVEKRFPLGNTGIGGATISCSSSEAGRVLSVCERSDRIFQIEKIFSPLAEQRQVRVVYEAVEIPQKEVRKLESGIHVGEDGDCAAERRAAALGALVRSSPKGKLVASLSTVAPFGKEVVVDGVQERTDMPSGSAAMVAGTRLKFTATVHDQVVIHLKLSPETTGFDGWRDSVVFGEGKSPMAVRKPCTSSLLLNTEFELYDGTTMQVARLHGKRLADSASSAFFGDGNILVPGAKLGEERDLFVFVTARIVEGE